MTELLRMQSLLSVVTTLPGAVTFLGACLIALFFYRRHLSVLSDIPGPYVASFSRLWQIRQILRGDYNLRLIDMHEKHGHFVRVSPNEVSVSHPDAIKQILQAPLSKGSWYKPLAIPDFRFQNRATTLDSASHRQMCRHLSTGFSLTNLLRLEDELDALTQKLKRLMDRSADQQTVVHLDNFFSYTSYDMAGGMLFSKDFGFLEQGKDVAGSIANTEVINQYIAIAGYIYWFHALLANPLVTALGVLPMGHLFNTAVNALAERQKNVDARADIVSYWLKAHEKDSTSLSLREVQGNTVFALGAGSDTVASALQAIVYHLVTHPAAYQRVREELDGAQAEGYCQTPIVSFSDTARLPYLQACIKESLRVFTPFAIGLPRVAGQGGVTIGDHTFPPGTVLSVHPWVIHHSKEFWGPDAGEYKPERWFADDISTRERYSVSFSAGYSSCPGQNMARIQLSKVTATVLRDYDIRLVDASKSWQWKARLTIVPHQWPVYIQKREKK